LLVNVADFVSPSTAARMLDMSKRHVLRLAEQGELIAVMTPIGRLIDRRSVEALAQERTDKRRGNAR
jgi:excisionase family DNA binding protein